MENKNIIIILIVLIVVLAAILGVVFFQSVNAKEASKIKITSNDTQFEGGKLTIILTDLNKTAISKEKVNITITNKHNKTVLNKTVETNSKGKAKLNLDLKKGKYSVNVSYDGNENYTGNSTIQNLTIKEEVKQATVVSSDPYPGYTYSPQYGTYVRQYKDSNGIDHIDGVNGMHETYNVRTGILTHDDGKGHVDRSFRG